MAKQIIHAIRGGGFGSFWTECGLQSDRIPNLKAVGSYGIVQGLTPEQWKKVTCKRCGRT